MQLIVRDERALLRFVLGFVPSIVDAGEIVQETVALLWEKRNEYDATKHKPPWLLLMVIFTLKRTLENTPL